MNRNIFFLYFIMFFIALFTSFGSAQSTINYLSKGLADIFYCKIDGSNCALGGGGNGTFDLNFTTNTGSGFIVDGDILGIFGDGNITTKVSGKNIYLSINSSVGEGTGTELNLQNGTGLTFNGSQFNHSDTSNIADSDNSGLTFIQDLTFDSLGHALTRATGSVTQALVEGLGFILGSTINSWITGNFSSLNNTLYSVGNWSFDKGSYYNVTQHNLTAEQLILNNQLNGSENISVSNGRILINKSFLTSYTETDPIFTSRNSTFLFNSSQSASANISIDSAGRIYVNASFGGGADPNAIYNNTAARLMSLSVSLVNATNINITQNLTVSNRICITNACLSYEESNATARRFVFLT